MRTPINGLTWEIWRRKRKLIWLLIGMLVFGWLLNLGMPDSIRAREGDRFASGMPLLMGLLNQSLVGASLLLVFAIFSYTEFNPQNELIGFPHRLFVLPVTSLRLVAVPMSLGVAAVEFLALAWGKLGMSREYGPSAVSTAVLLGAYMVFYQTTLWSLSALRSLRMVVLGLIAIVLLSLGFGASLPGAPHSERSVIAWIAVLSIVSFLAAWAVVARQRSGGRFSRDWFRTVGSSRVDLQACKLEYSIVSPK